MKNRTYFNIDYLSSTSETIGRFVIFGWDAGIRTVAYNYVIEFVLIFCAIFQNILQYYSFDEL